MTVIAILFLVGCFLRLVLIFLDDGFSGPVWTTIYWSSMMTWLLGAILAFDQLGLLPTVSW